MDDLPIFLSQILKSKALYAFLFQGIISENEITNLNNEVTPFSYECSNVSLDNFIFPELKIYWDANFQESNLEILTNDLNFFENIDSIFLNLYYNGNKCLLKKEIIKDAELTTYVYFHNHYMITANISKNISKVKPIEIVINVASTETKFHNLIKNLEEIDLKGNVVLDKQEHGHHLETNSFAEKKYASKFENNKNLNLDILHKVQKFKALQLKSSYEFFTFIDSHENRFSLILRNECLTKINKYLENKKERNSIKLDLKALVINDLIILGTDLTILP